MILLILILYLVLSMDLNMADLRDKSLKSSGIIQWNCRGIKPNYNEVQILLNKFSPSVLCLQETLLKDNDKLSFKNFSLYNHIVKGDRASGGSSIIIKNNIPHSVVNLNTSLQAVAISATLNKVLTICSLYIPPSHRLSIHELNDLVSQLPRPFIILGDFNAHHNAWGCNDIDKRGEIIEQFIDQNDLGFFNDKTKTYLHPATGHYSAIDLTICDPSLLPDYEWKVDDDLHGSDHFPIILKPFLPTEDDKIPRWKFNKADWQKFKILCEENLTYDILDREDPMTHFTNTLHEIAKTCIPRSSGNKTRSKPWFNDDCKTAIRKRRAMLKQFNCRPTRDNLEQFRIFRAKARRIIKIAKRNSWQSFVSKINSRTSSKKVWEIIC